MAWHSTHSRENDGVRDDTLERAIRRFCRVFVGGTGTFPADNLVLPPIICSTVSEHVFLTCHDCPISWNRFWPGPVAVPRCFDTVCSSRAGAACKGGNYASFDASCRCYPAACCGGFCAPSKRSGPIAFARSLRAGAAHLGPKLDAAAAAIHRAGSLNQDYHQRLPPAPPHA